MELLDEESVFEVMHAIVVTAAAVDVEFVSDKETFWHEKGSIEIGDG